MISQLEASRVYTDLHGRFNQDQLLAFSVWYLSMMAVGPFSEIDMFVFYVKNLAGWYYLIITGATEDGLQQADRGLPSHEALPGKNVGDPPDPSVA